LASELPRIDLLVYDVPHEDTATRTEFRGLDARLGGGAVAIVDHGPAGGLCEALAGWGRSRHTRPVRRRDLGLYAIRMPGRRGRDHQGRVPRSGDR